MNAIENSKIVEFADQLGELLKESKEYQEYCEAKSILLKDSESAQMLMDLRSQQVHLYLAQVVGEDVEEELTEFQNSYYAFSSKPEVSNFLYAEGRFTHLFNEVQKALGKKLELWTDLEVKVPDHNVFLN